MRAICAAARQIAAITAERQLKLGELLDEVVRRKAPASATPPPRLPPIATSSAPLLDLPLTADEPPAPLPSSFPLLALPGEIRNLVYAFCLTPTSGSPVIRPYSDRRRSAAGGITPALLATSRQVHAEATPILYGANTLELDIFKVPRFMFQIAGSSRWLRQVRVTGLAELKVLGAGRAVEADEVDGCSRERRRSGGGGALRRIVSARSIRARRERSQSRWGEGDGQQEEGEWEDGGQGWEVSSQREPLRLQLYLLHRATNLQRLEVVWCGGEAGALTPGSPTPPGNAEAAARDVLGLLYPWLAAVAAAKGEKKAAARIVRPFTHCDDHGGGVDRVLFRKKLGMLLEKGLQLENEAEEDMIVD